MRYCSECGSEVDEANAYCSDCGSEIDGGVESESDDVEGETGLCSKCDSEISVSAEKCPNCGYEPSSLGIILSLFGLVAFGVFSFCLLMVVILPILVWDSLDLMSGVIGFGLFGVVGAIAGSFLYLLYKQGTRTPVDDSVEFIGGD